MVWIPTPSTQSVSIRGDRRLGHAGSRLTQICLARISTLRALRMLVVSDLHYSLPQLDWVMTQAAEFEVVVLAGDLLDISSPVPLESQIVVVGTYLKRLSDITSTVVCSGNHDLTARNDHGEKHAPWIEEASEHGTAVDWMSLERDGVRITVCPWWDGAETRSDVAEQLRNDARDRPRRWIWIYHFPPDESPVSWIGTRHVGDSDLNAWIAEHRPDLVVTGHIHDSPFHDEGSWLARLGDTWVINAGHMRGTPPAHAIIDTAAETAEWWSPLSRDHQKIWTPTR